MEEKMELEPKYVKRIEEIDEKIRSLREEQEKWKKEGGVGPRMALSAEIEIKELTEERERILSGRQKKIDSIKEVQKTLELLKKRSSFLKRESFRREIKSMDKEVESLMRGK